LKIGLRTFSLKIYFHLSVDKYSLTKLGLKITPMVNIGNRPTLWHIMKIYSFYGFKDFILCLGYKGEMIKEYFYNYQVLSSDFTVELGNNKNIEMHGEHDEKDWRITLADTGEKALKGARVKRIEKYIDGDQFMMTYGDGLANININALLDFHNNHGNLVTVTGIMPAPRFGKLKINGDMVESFTEKPEGSHGQFSGGFFVFKKKFFDYVSDEDSSDLEIGALERVARDGQLMVYKHDGFWACMDTIRDREYLNKLWDENRAEWKVW